jgi:ferredoxin-NADP reductase
VVGRVDQTAQVGSLVLDCPGWPGHQPGQHVDVRLMADDGRQAERRYSIATPADGSRITLTVERLDTGEVSPYLVDELQVGDRLELRGPIGIGSSGGPNSADPSSWPRGARGLAPLMAMVRARAAPRSGSGWSYRPDRRRT